MRRRYTGKTKKAQYTNERQQRLTPAEEISIVDEILQLKAWNFPLMVSWVQELAERILRKREDLEPLEMHWPTKFLARHKKIASQWSQPLERDRANNATHEIISHWFKLIKDIIQKYAIQQEDTYNMDEKGFGMGLTGKEKVFCSKDNLEPKMKEPTNTKWVSLLECISANGGILPLYIIFKTMIMMESWLKELKKEDKIGISDKRWTNNYLGLEWFKQVFNLFTKKCQKGQYQLIIVDRHCYHITLDLIEFCRREKIIPACLPFHTTHLL